MKKHPVQLDGMFLFCVEKSHLASILDGLDLA